MNFYSEGDNTPYGMPVVSCQLQRCWEMLLEKSDYAGMVEETANFNKHNKYIKRGISVIPTKFGISFGISFLNQGGESSEFVYFLVVNNNNNNNKFSSHVVDNIIFGISLPNYPTHISVESISSLYAFNGISIYFVYFIFVLAASPPSGRLFLLVPAESFFGPTALLINLELSYDRFAVTPQL